MELKKRSLQPNAPFMSQEEMSIEVFGKRSGHIVGWGVGPKPSKASSTIGQLRARDEEVRLLRENLALVEERNDIQQQKIDAQQQKIEAQDKKFEDFQEYTMQMFAKIRKDQERGSVSGGSPNSNQFGKYIYLYVIYIDVITYMHI